MSKQMKCVLDKQLSGIAVHEQLEKRILTLPKARQKARRRSMAAIVVCGTLLIALSGLAATNPSFQRLLMSVGDKIAEALQPIELVSESNGIRMEVLAAMSDGQNAVAYFTLRDLTGERLLEGIIDPYDCMISGTRITNTRTAPYDEDTGTAMLSILGYGGEKLEGQKVTFRLRSFLVGRTNFEDVDIGIALDTVQGEKRSVWLAQENSAGGGGDFEWFYANKGMKILPPNEMHIPIPGVDFAYISNIGLIDGRLHVQTCFPKKKSMLDKQAGGNMDDHGGVWLEGIDSLSTARVFSDISVSFAVNDQGELCNPGYRIDDPDQDKVQYIEEVFPSNLDLAQYALRGDYTTNKDYITGDWSVAFRLQAVKAYKQAACDIDVGAARIHTVMVSPMGWTVLGEKGTVDSSVQAELLVKRTDGSEERIEVRDAISDGTTFEYHNFVEEPLDISLIQAVSVNGEEVRMLEKQ
ncbi:MAG: DUF4179 domain-containing protein [Candidatus Limiplasma sp.]|nr:DUF4179 domain-containing protein [Candidatus Limiplasma sp.]